MESTEKQRKVRQRSKFLGSFLFNLFRFSDSAKEERQKQPKDEKEPRE